MKVEQFNQSDFSIHNIPFGIYSTDGISKKVASRIGDFVIDLSSVADTGIFEGLNISDAVWASDFLNEFIDLGKPITNEVRSRLQAALRDENHALHSASNVFLDIAKVTMHLPIRVGDYTDFYSSMEHAMNLGIMFRGPENALMPNWRHLPVGYHGRASSIIESGIDIRRPKGQLKPMDANPIYSPTKRLDFELETAFIIGKNTELGQPVSTSDANDYIFGMVLFNDWSARDIQKWEYVPLGPFLGKNFASSISPWVVTLEALSQFKVDGPKQDPEVLPYLQYDGASNYDIKLEVSIAAGHSETVVSRSNFKYMYWNMRQQLAHHTVNGCNVKVGDMMASGTISGKDENSYGSMLEISKSGKNPIKLLDGSERCFIEDGDTVVMRGYGSKGDIKVGFGEVSTKVLPALD